MFRFNHKIILGFVVICMSLEGMDDFSLEVKTNDHKIVPLSESVREFSTQLFMQYAKKKSKKIEKIIVFASVSKEGLDLFERAATCLKKNPLSFEEYYKKTEDNGLLKKLINVVGKLESSELTAHLVHYYFPADISKYIASFVRNSSIEALRYTIITKNCGQNLRSITPVRIDLVGIQEKMIRCTCSKIVDSQKVFFNNSESVSVEIASSDRMSSILHCKRSGRSLALLGHKHPIVAAYFSSNDAMLLTCSYADVSNQHCMTLWDVVDFQLRGAAHKIKVINGHGLIKKITFSPSGDIFVVVLNSGIFRIYSGVSGIRMPRNRQNKGAENKLKGQSCPGIFFGCDGRLLVVTNFGSRSSCDLLNARTGKRLFSLNDKIHSFNAGYLSSDGSIITACLDRFLGGECFDLCGEENQTQLKKLSHETESADMLSIYALWRWSIMNEKSNQIFGDLSPLKDLITYF